jgi:lipid-A-disaccharide synthase
MGILGVIQNLQRLKGLFKTFGEQIEAFQPDAIIFIDYPGFNMRIATWAKERNIPTHYYISPQIWAWKENRIKAIKRDVDHMYVILPFEKEFYENRHNFPVSFVGHPLIDAIHQRKKITREVFLTDNKLPDKPISALLPGSRKQEITKMLSVMLSVTEAFPNYQFVIAGAPGQEYDVYQPFLKPQIHYLNNKTYDLLAHAEAALVTSGTATLETALYKVPEVVCYRGNWVSYQIAKKVITLNYISLVNLIMDKEVVKELIQNDLNTKNLIAELNKLLDENNRQELLKNYDLLEQKLGGTGASTKTAQKIVKSLSK